MPDALHGDVPASCVCVRVCVCLCVCLCLCCYVEALCGCVPVLECKYMCRIHVQYILFVCFCVFAFLFKNVFRTSHAERDVSMKRQLVEDLKTRLKFLQEIEKSYRGQVEDLEKKVHTAHHS